MILKLQVETLITQFRCASQLYSVVGKLWIDFLTKSFEEREKTKSSSLSNDSKSTHLFEMNSTPLNTQINNNNNITQHNVVSSLNNLNLSSTNNNNIHNNNVNSLNQHIKDDINESVEEDFTLGSLEDPNTEDEKRNNIDNNNIMNMNIASDSDSFEDREDGVIEEDSLSLIEVNETHHNINNKDYDRYNDDIDDYNPEEIASTHSQKHDTQSKEQNVFLKLFEKPKLSLTLCFLYLACLWIREPILVSDLIMYLSTAFISTQQF
jgi:hypothetical protein